MELQAVRDRVRHMIDDRHWPTDGEWKESVLRTMIRRSAPSTVSVGRGFVVTSQGATTQLDILVYDNSHPVLYRDGDLVFVSPAACRAIVEVKSRITASALRTSCKGLANAADFIRRGRGGSRTFVGLFSYEEQNVSPEAALNALDLAAEGSGYRIIDHIALGDSKFIKWWRLNPLNSVRPHDSWHSYRLHQMAAGYFLHNLLMHLSPDVEQEGDAAWFPNESKEVHQSGERRLGEAYPSTNTSLQFNPFQDSI